MESQRRHRVNQSAGRWEPSLVDFGGIQLAQLLDLNASAAYLSQVYQTGGTSGPVCPKCRTALLQDRARESWRAGKVVKCRACKTGWTWRSGTPFEGSGIKDPRAAVLLLAGLWVRVNDAHLARWTGATAEAVRKWRRQLVPAGLFPTPQLLRPEQPEPSRERP